MSRTTGYVRSNAFYHYCLAARLALQMKWDRLNLGMGGGFVLDMSMSCGEAALVIHAHLQEQDINSAIVYGTFNGKAHCWVEASQYIIDITATQFGRDIPPVVLLQKKRAIRIYGYYSDAKFQTVALFQEQFPSTLTKREIASVDRKVWGLLED